MLSFSIVNENEKESRHHHHVEPSQRERERHQNEVVDICTSRFLGKESTLKNTT